jgi:hypothetical protein
MISLFNVFTSCLDALCLDTFQFSLLSVCFCALGGLFLACKRLLQ